MAETTLQLGFVPKERGNYTSGTNYYKDNVVQYNGSSYIADPVGWSESEPTATYVTVPPTDVSGNLNAGWRVFASGNNTFTTGEKVDNVGIDNEPTAGSDNLVKSGGVAVKINELKEELHAEPTHKEYIRFLDGNGNVGAQLPIGFDGEQILNEIDEKAGTAELDDETQARELADEERPTSVVVNNNVIDITDKNGNIAVRLPVGFDARDLISEGISIFLPDVINAVVGDTLQIFYQSIVQVFDISKYNIVALCDKGKDLKRYFEYTPEAADIGTDTLTFEVRDDNGKILTTKSTSLITNAAPSEPASSKTILVFGDSVTAGGEWVHEVERRLTASDGIPVGDNLSNIIFAGKLSHEGTKYFGYGGWWWKQYIEGAGAAFRFYVENVTSLKMYGKYTNNGYQYEIREINVTGTSGNILCITSAITNIPEASGTLTKISGGGDSTITFTSVEAASQSPLYDAVNNIFTFTPYVTEYCNGKCDAVYVLLSANHQTPWRKEFAEEMAYVKQWADTLHSEYPNAKLRLVGLQPPSVTGGCGFSYGADGGYSDEYGIKVTFQRQCECYQEFAHSVGYSSWVQYVDVASQFDALYNMPYEMKDVNIRNSDKQEMSGINGVHPNNSGYMQIADAVYRNIVATFCQ